MHLSIAFSNEARNSDHWHKRSFTKKMEPMHSKYTGSEEHQQRPLSLHQYHRTGCQNRHRTCRNRYWTFRNRYQKTYHFHS